MKKSPSMTASSELASCGECAVGLSSGEGWVVLFSKPAVGHLLMQFMHGLWRDREKYPGQFTNLFFESIHRYVVGCPEPASSKTVAFQFATEQRRARD